MVRYVKASPNELGYMTDDEIEQYKKERDAAVSRAGRVKKAETKALTDAEKFDKDFASLCNEIAPIAAEVTSMIRFVGEPENLPDGVSYNGNHWQMCFTIPSDLTAGIYKYYEITFCNEPNRKYEVTGNNGGWSGGGFIQVFYRVSAKPGCENKILDVLRNLQSALIEARDEMSIKLDGYIADDD